MKSDPRDYHLDIRSAPVEQPDTARMESDAAGKPYLMVMFACCKTYQRVYAARDGKRYEARCPRCMRSITFKVGAGGTDRRVFVVE